LFGVAPFTVQSRQGVAIVISLKINTNTSEKDEPTRGLVISSDRCIAMTGDF